MKKLFIASLIFAFAGPVFADTPDNQGNGKATATEASDNAHKASKPYETASCPARVTYG